MTRRNNHQGDAMKKPKLLIIVLFQNLGDEHPYYARNPAPPLPGILLARDDAADRRGSKLLHEMVRPIDYSTDADFIALSFMDYLAPHAYEVAARFRKPGRSWSAEASSPAPIPTKSSPTSTRSSWARRRGSGRGWSGTWSTGTCCRAMTRPAGRLARRHPSAAVRPGREDVSGPDGRRSHPRLSPSLHVLPAEHPTDAPPDAAGRGRPRRPEEHPRACPGTSGKSR